MLKRRIVFVILASLAAVTLWASPRCDRILRISAFRQRGRA
jgi:hypothetical protein